MKYWIDNMNQVRMADHLYMKDVNSLTQQGYVVYTWSGKSWMKHTSGPLVFNGSQAYSVDESNVPEEIRLFKMLTEN